jgi:uncharacterized protein YgiM (DUF1202 family)
MKKWAVLCLCLLVPATALCAGEAQFALTHGEETALYAQAATSSEAVMAYAAGTWAEVLDAQGGFYHVTAQDGKEGYMEKDALIPEAELGRLTVVSDRDGIVNLRVEPSMDARIRRYLKAGKQVEAFEADEKFTRCRVNGEVEGYIANVCVKADGDAAVTATVISESGARMRKGPGMAYEQVRNIGNGAQVQVLAVGSRWVKVEYKEYVGFVADEALAR